MNKIERHEQICKYLDGLYASKNHDYGDSFGETYRKLGKISAVTRITDKYNRMVSLVTIPNDQKIKDESLRDTLLDMANYCIMFAMELDIEKEGEK